jgi:hypothetical protein
MNGTTKVGIAASPRVFDFPPIRTNDRKVGGERVSRWQW